MYNVSHEDLNKNVAVVVDTLLQHLTKTKRIILLKVDNTIVTLFQKLAIWTYYPLKVT